MKLILASGSPRRQELLSHLGVEFEVVVSGFDEESISDWRPAALAKRLAGAKAMEVALQYPDALVLAADTIVVYRGEMLGKPSDAAEARKMLQLLRGRMHTVITGFALAAPRAVNPLTTGTISRVRMRSYTDEEIEDTIARGVPFDKAGGYGIQDPVLRPVEACEGCFCSVMGLHLWTVALLLRGVHIKVDTSGMPERCATCPARPAGVDI